MVRTIHDLTNLTIVISCGMLEYVRHGMREYVRMACNNTFIWSAYQRQYARMVCIAVSPAAFNAITATPSVRSFSFEAERGGQGERLIWLDASVVERLRAMHGPGESYSDVILRLV